MTQLTYFRPRPRGRTMKSPGLTTKLGLALFLGAFAWVVPWTVAQAVPFTTDLIIAGDISFDTVDSFTTGSAVQSGNFSTKEVGIPTSSTFSGASVTSGANPLLGTLTDIGDGFGMDATAIVSSPDEFFLGIDFAINHVDR